jgi:hypothetical protein
MRQKSFLLPTVSILLACGGGNNAANNGVGSNSSNNMSECFQLTTGNEFAISSTPNSASYFTDASRTSTAYYNKSSNTSVIQADIYDGKSVQAVKSITISTPMLTNPTAADSKTTTAFDKVEISTSKKTPLAGDAVTVFGNGLSDYKESYKSTGSIDLTIQAKQTANMTFISTLTNSSSSAVIKNTAEESITFVGYENVTTKAGTFKNTCKISFSSKLSSDLLNYKSTTEKGTRWVAPGFGVVKSETTISYTDGRIPSDLTIATEITSVIKGSF